MTMDWNEALTPKKKTEAEELREWIRDEERRTLCLLHQALVDIALGSADPQGVAWNALQQLALRHPEVVEILVASEADAKTKRSA